MRKVNVCIGTIALATVGIAAAATALNRAELIPIAKISFETATATALQARPGTVTVSELEKEKGGSGLRYSFDVTAAAKRFEVGIDAKTGKVLENKAEGKNPA